MSTIDGTNSASQASAGRPSDSTMPTMKEATVMEGERDEATNGAVRSKQPSRSAGGASGTRAGARSQNQQRSIFSLPAPVKRVFDRFPVKEYEAEELPLRSRRRGGRNGAKARGTEEGGNTLYVFTTEEDAKCGRPSYNPGCLKWQTYLRFHDVDFSLIPSSNHASPSGSLPFLQPGTRPNPSSTSESSPTTTPDPIPANRLRKWLATQNQQYQQQRKNLEKGPSEDVRSEAYQTLIDNRIRKLWLYQLYLAPQNDLLLQRLYVEPCSRNVLVRYTITRQLRAAAEAELVKSAGSNIVDVEDLIREAGDAWEALSILLGEDVWFFGRGKPGLFDASVFAYSQLVLGDHGEDGEGLKWKYNPLGEGLGRYENLVGHRARIWEEFFSEGEAVEESGGGSGVESVVERPGIHARTTSTLGKRKTLKG